ncbi:DUF1330 domain-containing protein [Alterisphingorhabdus coralli]|uniref:DUF1330 domain-containing protein n=1 Tax=Alterisphingorhabdus coralli TaxID=3071408 RepID=A0AA97F9S8_9SPHN|nr:DUF1330 domain-containing protein [Parasphingorhabdus sp. SCSIO 66989]WOE75848.1 DUF1330 domain-containing protein [Parasphingorhabdus sp. SCSIO 66989]
MSVYVIAHLTIHDRDRYNRYQDGFMEVFEKFDGTMLSVDEEPMVLDGEFTATRSVLIEFPSKGQAMAWMTSPEYQEIAKHRVAASTANSILVQGLDPEAALPGTA